MIRSSVQHPVVSPKLLLAAIFAIASGLGATYAGAQTLSAAEAQERYRADVERCRSGVATQDQRTCMREAGAALEEARRNRLVTGTPSFDQNQRARCERLSGAQRDDCLQLMSDTGATVHGSVEGGGILRETTITIPADPTTPATTPPGYQSGTTPSGGTDAG